MSKLNFKGKLDFSQMRGMDNSISYSSEKQHGMCGIISFLVLLESKFQGSQSPNPCFWCFWDYDFLSTSVIQF